MAFDAVEVCGSSPHGPTTIFNILERFLQNPSETSPVNLRTKWGAESKNVFLSQWTLITKRPEQFNDDVPISEYSLMDVSGLTANDENLPNAISQEAAIECADFVVLK